MNDFFAEFEPEAARRCRACGCTDDHACLGADGYPCFRVEPDLCSECAFTVRAVQLRGDAMAALDRRLIDMAIALVMAAIVVIALVMLEPL
jgi:hypothetical protein